METYINEKTRVVYIETPTNPMMNVTDIAELAKITKKHRILLIVDNTFLSEIMKKQARGFGAMITFQLENRKFALAVLEKVRMIKFAESLGGVETLITYPVTQTHADVPPEIRERNGITDSTLRLSVGIENSKDLLNELEQVFHEIESSQNLQIIHIGIFDIWKRIPYLI